VKQAACSKDAVRQHQTTCCPDEFWTTVWRMWWCKTSGDGDWPQEADLHASDRYDGAQLCSDLNITSVLPVLPQPFKCYYDPQLVKLPVKSRHGVRQAASAIPAEQVRCVHDDQVDTAGVRQAASAIPAEQVRCVHDDPSASLTCRQRFVQTAVVEVSCRWCLQNWVAVVQATGDERLD